MNSNDVERFFKTPQKFTLVIVAIALMTAVSGYFMGLRQTRDFSDEKARYQREQLEQDAAQSIGWGDIPRAVPYSELAGAGFQPNAGWKNVVTNLPAGPQGPLAPVVLADGEREAALAVRESRRAYDGAPPVVPHPIAQRSAGSCLICHGESDQPLIAGKMPPRMSHANFASCTQCHVAVGGHGEGVTWPDLGFETVENGFPGRTGSGPGSRAFAGAPPTIPHHTLMRENCSSCHGPGRANAIRTTHPYRQSCNQCHAPSAELDQRHFDLAGIRTPVRFPVRPRPLMPVRDPEPSVAPGSQPVRSMKMRPDEKRRSKAEKAAKTKGEGELSAAESTEKP